MTIANGYVTEDAISSWVSSDGTSEGLAAQHRADLEAKVEVASRAIDAYVGDRFYNDTADTTRLYGPDALHYDRKRSAWVCSIAWCNTFTSVSIDEGDTGTFTVVSTSDYTALPYNGVRGGITGWPADEIIFHTASLRDTGIRPVVKVIGRHGWASTHNLVSEACLIAARDLKANSNTNFAMVATEYGAMRIRENSEVARLLAPFRRISGTSGIGGIA